MGKYMTYGQLVDDKDKPISSIPLKAIADYSSTFADDPLLGETSTDKNGKFEILLSLSAEFMENNKNQIKIDFLIDEKSIMNVSKGISDFKNVIEEQIIDFGIIRFNKGNIGIDGRIIDEKGNPIEGLTVIAEDVDYGKLELNALDLIGSKFKSFFKNKNLIVDEGILGNSLDFIKDKFQLLLFFRDDYLGSSVTDKNGYYSIIYPQESYREILDKEPDIRVIVKDKLGVFELRESEVHQNISSTFEKINDIIINRAEIEGWLVTLNTDSPSRITSNNNFEILIDNHQAWEKIVEVVDSAMSYIYLTQFVFYPEFIPKFFSSSEDPSDYTADETLAYKLLESQKRGVDVKIIINENRVVPDNYDELNDYFKDSEVEVRRYPAKGPYSMHAKVLVADGEKGFIIGSPFTQSYWDTSKHDINEPRRLNKNEGPYHDVSTYFEGPVINHLEEFFIDLWNYLSDLHFKGENKIIENKSLNKETINDNTSEKLPDFNSLLRVENEPLQIVRSITPQSLTKKGETGVLEAYRKAITNAEDFIYLENQYFTNKYIIGALKKALELKPDLQIIMLINEVPDVPTYRSWQHYGFEFMGLDLQKLIIENPQIGVFAKWSGKFQNGKNKLRNCYIHSKVAIVDDIWATIGTSNLDGSSLSFSEEFGSSELSVNHRNMEMNALMFDMESPRSGNIENFRKILWGEHLGMEITNLERPQDGWLDLWKDKGYYNLSQLEKEEIILHGGILPYSTKNNPKEQIKDLVEQYRRIKARFNR
jgi:phosphatidylserine/phosphatidylglycerophosphate/cardiolipin synthase-like enzyme